MRKNSVHHVKRSKKEGVRYLDRFDKKQSNSTRTIITILIFMLLFSITIEIFQNGVLRSLQKDIDRLELIAEDYCSSSLSKQEYCDSVLIDEVEENKLLIVKP